MQSKGFQHYLTITGGYWAFTITDGSLRMLVLLYFHQLGYSPFAIASLFLFYELFGVITNLIGGWLGSRIGLNRTMHIGMILQILALMMLTVPQSWLSVGYVMLAQALSGIAKDLNKMSAKASIKTLLPDARDSGLLKWIAVLTGSKNALKGAGFFAGAALLSWLGFKDALFALSGLLTIALLSTWLLLPKELGKSSDKKRFHHIFSNSAAVNWLSAARFFLFGARDIWFVVALPVFMQSILQWSFVQTGSFLALWIIGYGFFQTIAPNLLKLFNQQQPNGQTLIIWKSMLLIIPVLIALSLNQQLDAELVLIIGLSLFGFFFAMNSAIHSYLIVAWADADKVSLNVGFYYMANAAGRLTGTLLSGLLYQLYGLNGCLYASALFIAASLLPTFKLGK